MPLPDRLVDHNTIVKNHDVKDHLVSVIARIILGILIINGDLSRDFIIPFCIIVVIIFSYKYVYNPGTWKVYLRTVLSYSTMGILQYLQVDNANTATGTIAILDALMGLQSRYVQANMLE
jgi:hypothetical protein